MIQAVTQAMWRAYSHTRNDSSVCVGGGHSALESIWLAGRAGPMGGAGGSA